MSLGSGGQSNQAKTAANTAQGTANTALNNAYPQINTNAENLLNLGNSNINSGLGMLPGALSNINTGLGMIPGALSSLQGAQNTIAPATNYFNSVLNGNQADTTAALQPGIDQIRGGVANNLTAVNTLTPRGGGRSATNYGLSFAPQSQEQNLFNTARTSAATALPQIGSTLGNIGTSIGNLGLGTAGVGTSIGNLGLGAAGVGLGQLGSGTNLFGTGINALNAATGGANTAGQLGIQNQQLGNQFWSNFGSGLMGLATTPFGGGSSVNGLLGLL